MAKQSVSKWEETRNSIAAYLISHGDYRTPKQISIAVGISHKEVNRSIGDIREREEYIVLSRQDPLRIKIKDAKTTNRNWKLCVFGMKK